VILALLAFAAAQSIPLPPQQPPLATGADEARFEACVALARSNPTQAVDEAGRWIAANGGLQARQCLGAALVVLQRWAPAATVYEQAARSADARTEAVRADLWVQAGNAWLAAGDNNRALAAIDGALAIPNLTAELRGEAHVDHGRAQVALGHADLARRDFDQALQLVPADPFAWYLSAALARRANDLARARTDIARAVQLAPGDPDVTLLAGTIAGLSGHMDEAERLYRQLIQAAPDSEAGRAAAASLATMREVEVPAAAPAATTPAPHP
jgi:tetratricopeptide (TPR) repeat protein